MGKTTLTVYESTRERFNDHFRHDEHQSVDEALSGLMDRSASVSSIEDSGCSNCDKTIPTPPEGRSGLSSWVAVEGGGEDETHAEFFCSASCAEETRSERRAYTPRDPDLVVVGGYEALRADVEGASMVLNRDAFEIAVDVPGAFSGTDSHGDREYDYVGEPAYVKNEGKWVQKGVIEDILHEEAHTALLLSPQISLPSLFHPDEDEREDGEVVACPECGGDVAVVDGADEAFCTDCEIAFDPEEGDG